MFFFTVESETKMFYSIERDLWHKMRNKFVQKLHFPARITEREAHERHFMKKNQTERVANSTNALED